MKPKKSPRESSLVSDLNAIDKTSIIDGIAYANEIESLAKFPSENPNPVIRLSSEGTVLYSNKAGEPFINGWNNSQGNKIPDNVFRMISGIANGSHKDIEIECCDRIFLFTVVPIAKEGYINLYGHDITQQKLAEERLRFQANIIQNISDVIYATDLKMRVTEWNAAAERFYGWKEKDVIGKSVGKATGSEFDTKKQRELARILKEKGIYRTQIEHTAKSGSTLFLDSITMVHKNAEGQIIGYISANRDITDKVLADKALKESEEALLEARRKLNIALENAGIGLWEWDHKTGEFTWDEKLEKMFGITTGTFGKTFTDFENLLHEEDIVHVRKSVKNTIEKGLPFESIFRTKPESGKSKYISSRAFLTKNKTGKVLKFSGVCFDITGMREETEHLILELNEELLRSNKELESFAYVASHDLQEPLRMVTSFTQLLEKRYKEKLDERGLEYIRFASEGAKRMYNLLNGLLAYSRITRKEKVFYEVNMNHVLDAVIKNLSFKIAERKAVIKIRKLPLVIADENQMIQLFQNLISNSIRFSPGTPRINISCRVENNHFLFSVKDKGIGIEPQYFERIFQIFQRLHPKEQYEGTGIGLAICKRIVERHGGKICVKSEPEKGSTFMFTIPRKGI